MNSTIRPFSNDSWIVEIEGSSHQLGFIHNSQGMFSVIAEPPTSPLSGIHMGPWSSKEDAMEAIAETLKGTCRLGY